MEASPLDGLRMVLSGIAEILGQLKAGAGLFTLNRPGSLAAAEVAAETTVAGHRPVTEAYSFADLRVAAAVEQAGALARLLDETGAAFSAAAVSRTAIENAARAAWLMDPRIDGTARGHRALAELFESRSSDRRFMEMLAKERVDVPKQQDAFLADRAALETQYQELVEGLDGAGLLARSRRGGAAPIGVVGVALPNTTDVIRNELGGGELLAWKELSAVAHGSPTALVRQTKPLAANPGQGMQVVSAQVSTATLAPSLATVFLGIREAIDRMVVLRGWDRRRWKLWSVSALGAFGGVLSQGDPPS